MVITSDHIPLASPPITATIRGGSIQLLHALVTLMDVTIQYCVV